MLELYEVFVSHKNCLVKVQNVKGSNCLEGTVENEWWELEVTSACKVIKAAEKTIAELLFHKRGTKH